MEAELEVLQKKWKSFEYGQVKVKPMVGILLLQKPKANPTQFILASMKSKWRAWRLLTSCRPKQKKQLVLSVIRAHPSQILEQIVLSSRVSRSR